MPKRGHREPSKVQVEVGKRLRVLRLAKGLSQGELAKRTGSSPASLSKLEAGQRAPTVATLDALARALGVRIADFFERKPIEPVASESDRAWVRLEGRIRGKSASYIRAVEDLVQSFDRSLRRLEDERGRGSRT